MSKEKKQKWSKTLEKIRKPVNDDYKSPAFKVTKHLISSSKKDPKPNQNILFIRLSERLNKILLRKNKLGFVGKLKQKSQIMEKNINELKKIFIQTDDVFNNFRIKNDAHFIRVLKRIDINLLESVNSSNWKNHNILELAIIHYVFIHYEKSIEYYLLDSNDKSEKILQGLDSKLNIFSYLDILFKSKAKSFVEKVLKDFNKNVVLSKDVDFKQIKHKIDFKPIKEVEKIKKNIIKKIKITDDEKEGVYTIIPFIVNESEHDISGYMYYILPKEVIEILNDFKVLVFENNKIIFPIVENVKKDEKIEFEIKVRVTKGVKSKDLHEINHGLIISKTKEAEELKDLKPKSISEFKIKKKKYQIKIGDVIVIFDYEFGKEITLFSKELENFLESRKEITNVNVVYSKDNSIIKPEDSNTLIIYWDGILLSIKELFEIKKEKEVKDEINWPSEINESTIDKLAEQFLGKHKGSEVFEKAFISDNSKNYKNYRALKKYFEEEGGFEKLLNSKSELLSDFKSMIDLMYKLDLEIKKLNKEVFMIEKSGKFPYKVYIKNNVLKIYYSEGRFYIPFNYDNLTNNINDKKFESDYLIHILERLVDKDYFKKFMQDVGIWKTPVLPKPTIVKSIAKPNIIKLNNIEHAKDASVKVAHGKISRVESDSSTNLLFNEINNFIDEFKDKKELKKNDIKKIFELKNLIEVHKKDLKDQKMILTTLQLHLTNTLNNPLLFESTKGVIINKAKEVIERLNKIIQQENLTIKYK